MDRDAPRCSFCGKTQAEVRLVAGPSGVYICHFCVALCAEILSHGAPPPGLGDGPPAGEPGQLIRTEIRSSVKAAKPETAGR